MAAAALDLGWSDPLSFLRQHGLDWRVAQEIVVKAQEIRAERVRAESESLAALVVNALEKATKGS